MTLAELIAAYRAESLDNVKPYFVSDDLAKGYANEAQKEACRRAIPLRDSSMTASVTAGEPLVPISKKVVRVIRARLQSQSRPMDFMTTYEMDCGVSAWETITGIPQSIITDYQNNALRLWPIPMADDTLLLTVDRLPLKLMESDDDEPELREEYHDALVDWMLHKAYSRPDADMFDPNRASQSLADFEREFGSRASARNEEWMRQRHTTDAAPIA